MTAYTLMINEEQRVALLAVLKTCDAGVSDNEVDEPLAYWQDMLTNLPAEEASAPGVTHGFCL